MGSAGHICQPGGPVFGPQSVDRWVAASELCCMSMYVACCAIHLPATAAQGACSGCCTAAEAKKCIVERLGSSISGQKPVACCRPTASDLGTARSPTTSATSGPQLQQPHPNPATQLGQLLLSIRHASSPAAGQQHAQWHPASQLECRLCQSHVSQLSSLP